MKKRLIFLIVLSATVELSTNANPWVWLSKKISNNSVLSSISFDNIIKEINKMPSKIRAKFDKHKSKLVELQNNIKSQIALLSKSPDEQAVKKLEELADDLQVEGDQLMDEAAQEMNPSDFARLKAFIENQIKYIKAELTVSNVAEQLTDIWKKYSTRGFKNRVLADKAVINSTAHVTKGGILSTKETVDFKKNRMPYIKKGLTKFFDHTVNKPITIAFAGSGGGYRAMISTVGYLSALEDLGLLNALTYVAGLSGSSWCIVPWISSGKSIRDLKNNLVVKIKNKRFDVTQLKSALRTDVNLLVNDIIWPKFIFDQPIGSIDLYGALLAKVLLADFVGERQKKKLSDQWLNIKNGSLPFPLYAAISMHGKDPKHEKDSKYFYNWYEFNPLEVRNLELGLSIPLYSFNSIFNAGLAKEVAPEQSLGFFMGTFGSVYTMNLRDLKANYFPELQAKEKKQSAFEKVKYSVVNKIIQLIDDSVLGTVRISAAQVNNPFMGLTGIPDWLNKRETISLVDAGLAYNVPVRSLFIPKRKIDVIIIADASSDSAEAAVLKKVFEDAQRVYAYNYQRVNDKSNKTLFLYKDSTNDNAPRIIYINFVKDSELMKSAKKNPELQKLIDDNSLNSFDVIECMAKGSCGTFNFNYSVNDFLQLSGMAEFNIKANKKAIQQFIEDEFY